MKNYFKKKIKNKKQKNKPAGFKLAKTVLMVLLATANSGGLAQLFSVTRAASSPALQQPQDPQVQALTLFWAMGARAGPSVMHILLGACGLRSFQVALSPVLWIWAHCPPHLLGSTRQLGGEDTGAAAAGEFPKLPPSVFFFLRKSSCSILPLHTRKGLSSHTAHLSS